MQFTISAAFLTLLGSAFAQTANFDAITVPTKDQELVADGKQSYKITWDPTAEYDGQDVSILLLQGASESTLDFYPGADVASSIDSALGTYTWTPDSDIAGYATYGLKLQLDSDTTIFQYSFPFKIKAGSDAGTTSIVSSSSSSSSSSGSSSSSSLSSTVSTKTTTPSSSSSAAATSVASNEESISTTATAGSSSVISASTTLATTSAGSATGSGSSSAQTTLTTATKPSSTGSAASSSTSVVVSAGAGRAVAGGFAAMGGVIAAAVLAL